MYIFDCDICNHTFKSQPSNIKKDNWCPYCSHTILCVDINCVFCYNNSFAISDMAIYWSKVNNVSPRTVFKYSAKKYIFDCNICNQTFLSRVADISMGSRCPCIQNKTETQLREWFLKNKINILSQVKFEWCKNPDSGRKLSYDFLIESLNIIIELDGRQHFEQVSIWQSPELTINNDIYKMKQAIDNDYTVIRLLQNDVWRNKNNWSKKCIDTHAINNKSYYFLCTNNEYDNHEKLLIESLNNDQ